MTLGPNGIWPVPDTCPPARFVYVGVPAYSHQVAVRTMVALSRLSALLPSIGIKIAMDPQPGWGFIDHVRNMIVTRFLRSPATDLLFWDSDIDCDEAAVLPLVKATRPFVCGVYPLKSDAGGWPISFDKDSKLEVDEDGLVSNPQLVPTGFLRLNRCVFDALPYVPYQTDDGGRWLGYFPPPGPCEGFYRGEDWGFTNLWRQRGGKCYAIPNLILGHTGVKTWVGQWTV